MPNLRPYERADVIRVTTDINRLLQLDEVWTEAVTAELPLDEARSLVDEMRELLARMPIHANRFDELVRIHRDSAGDALKALLWDGMANLNDRDDLRMWVGGRTVGGIWSDAANVLTDPGVSKEVDLLEEQLSRLSHGKAVAGDLSPGFRCGAANGLLTGGVLLMPSGVGAGVGLLGVGTLAATAGFATGGVGLLIAGTALWWAHRNHC